MTNTRAVGFLFERTTRIIKLKFHQLFKENGLDITPEQWVVIDILHQSGVLSQKQIADFSFKDAPSISRIIQNLLKRDLIEKTTGENDKRIVSVCLTDKGNRLIERILPQVENLRIDGLKGLEDDEITVLMNAMDKIFDNYK